MCLREGSVYLESSEVMKFLKAGASRIDSGSITSAIKEIKASVYFYADVHHFAYTSWELKEMGIVTPVLGFLSANCFALRLPHKSLNAISIDKIMKEYKNKNYYNTEI